MKTQDKAFESGYRDNCSGVKFNRNPFQYTSNIFMEAAWITGWKKAEKDEKKPVR